MRERKNLQQRGETLQLTIYTILVFSFLIGVVLLGYYEWKVFVIQLFAILLIFPRHTIFSKKIFFFEKYLIDIHRIGKKYFFDMIFIISFFVISNISEIIKDHCIRLSDITLHFLYISLFSIFWYLVTFKINPQNSIIKKLLSKKWIPPIVSIFFSSYF